MKGMDVKIYMQVIDMADFAAIMQTKRIMITMVADCAYVK